nr:hypothetical protein [uncultured Oscillibacter sp.]
MSVPYGKHWKIDGLIAGPITRHGSVNGSYSIIFERENGATLESIEAVDWARPSVQHLPACPANEAGLPEGYGFQLGNIEYHHNAGYFNVTVTTAKQYLGDVTGYQARIEELEGRNAALSGQVTDARTKEAELASAYEEGVESNG